MAENKHIAKIIDFLTNIGLDVVEGDVPDDSFLPHVIVWEGKIIVRRESVHPGNLLHESGHMAVLTGEARKTAHKNVGTFYGEEAAATAWAYGVALELGIPPEDIFNNTSGFKEKGDEVCRQYKGGSTSGVALLFNFGMSLVPGFPPLDGEKNYPEFHRWLRA